MTTAEMNSGPRFTLRDRCRKARKDAGLEQGELADRIEVSRTTISNYETGKVGERPMRSTLKRWALTCNVDPEWLMTGVEAEGKAAPGGTPDGDLKKPGITTLNNRTGPGRNRGVGRGPGPTAPLGAIAA